MKKYTSHVKIVKELYPSFTDDVFKKNICMKGGRET